MNAHTQLPPVPDYLPGLLGRLRANLAELAGRGFHIRWITAGAEELAQLFIEGGDDVVQLDQDPSADRAWFEGVEIRPSSTPGCFVYIEGEYDEMSRYCI